MRKLLFLITVVSLVACKPSQVIVHDIEYKTNVKHDSINVFQRDSIRITQKGDTVFYQVFKTQFRDKVSVRYDSIYKYKDKPVYLDRTITKYTTRELNWFQKAFITIGAITSILLIVFVSVLMIRNQFKIKNIFNLFGNQNK
ncbi:MAG: hypothetical protein RIS29_2471 [Bacteroidota bacterium]|jgi:hypothetical protein